LKSQKEYDLKEFQNQNVLIKRIEKQLTSGDCSNLLCLKSKLSSLFVSNSATKDKCINICFRWRLAKALALIASKEITSNGFNA